MWEKRLSGAEMLPDHFKPKLPWPENRSRALQFGECEIGRRMEGRALGLHFCVQGWSFGLALDEPLIRRGILAKSLSPSGLRGFPCEMELGLTSKGSCNNKVKMKSTGKGGDSWFLDCLRVSCRRSSWGLS